MNMKTIGKKIKAIYFLAVIAIVSMCMAILPLMSTNVKAETKESGLKVVGAQVIVIDDTTTAQNFDGKYSISFQAEFTKDLFDSLNIRNNVAVAVKIAFGISTVKGEFKLSFIRLNAV